MGVLIEGIWRDEERSQETGRSGEFLRADSRFRDRITANGSSGFKAGPAATTSMSRTVGRGRIALAARSRTACRVIA
jgi:glutathionyl-hydroquinone reductase